MAEWEVKIRFMLVATHSRWHSDSDPFDPYYKLILELLANTNGATRKVRIVTLTKNKISTGENHGDWGQLPDGSIVVIWGVDPKKAAKHTYEPLVTRRGPGLKLESNLYFLTKRNDLPITKWAHTISLMEEVRTLGEDDDDSFKPRADDG